MRRIALLLTLLPITTPLAIAQQTTPAPTQATQPQKYDPELRQNVIRLVDLTGARQRMAASLDQMAERGKEQLRRTFPSDTPAYLDEWARRMRSRTSIDDYVAVFILVYEKHFSNSDILELIQAQQDTKDKKPASISDQLRDKIDSIQATVQSEISTGCTQVGAKLGREISLEIAKEHPDWITPPQRASAVTPPQHASTPTPANNSPAVTPPHK
jgi:hypothetical protein